jgi:predicted ATP-grasp superfamily ATP-dependent carboligase
MAVVLVPEYLGQQVRAGIRSLRNQGDSCDLAWSSYPVRSVYVRNFLPITPSDRDDAAYIADVVALCKKGAYDFILPFGNTSCYAVSKHHDVLSANSVRFMLPPFETFTIAHDKFKTISFCREIGIQTPEVFTDYSGNDIRSIAGHLRYPVVIKAKSGVGVATGLRYANNASELVRFYEEVSSFQSKTGASNFEAPMIQEFIPGFIHDACTLTNHGKVVAILTQRRHVMSPIYGGVGAVNVTTHNKELADLARRILEALPWHGPAQIEFKYDERDKRYKLIEINPKLWGTLDLSIKAGVDFPGMIRDILLEKEIRWSGDYPEGLRYKFFFPQALTAYTQLKREFGIGGLFDSERYRKTFNDIDYRDVVFDAYRAYGAFRSFIRDRGVVPISNIDKRLINRL